MEFSSGHDSRRLISVDCNYSCSSRVDWRGKWIGVGGNARYLIEKTQVGQIKHL